MKKKRTRRTKAEIESAKAVERPDVDIVEAVKDKNPQITFLKKNGKPVLLYLNQCLDPQVMKERAYALGYYETFADLDAEVKTKGIKYKGEDAWSIIQRTYRV